MHTLIYIKDTATCKIPEGLSDRQPELEPAHLLHCQKSSPAPVFPRETKKGPSLFITFYRGTTKSMLTNCISLWHDSSSTSDRKGTEESGEGSRENHQHPNAIHWELAPTTVPVKGRQDHQGHHSPLSQTLLPPAAFWLKVLQPEAQDIKLSGQFLPNCFTYMMCILSFCYFYVVCTFI